MVKDILGREPARMVARELQKTGFIRVPSTQGRAQPKGTDSEMGATARSLQASNCR